ncbi:hypothetical protein ACFONN_13230 [Dyella humi]|uniref:Uncharacterized protein n=1 Tax=Dyella humi TaxID=1770547 RepID=A0ABW8IMX9_9GAMM
MSRLSQKQYEWRVLVAMGFYTACMLLEWPLVRTAASLPVKCLLALVPVVPVVYVIALLARRIRASDELEQQTHLIGLGIATAVVGVLSLIGGFLSTANVLKLDGSILIWVFPGLMLCYGVARWRVARRYGGGMFCESDSALAKHASFIIAGGVLLLAAWLCRSTLDALRLGFLCGTGAGLLGLGVVLAIAQRRRRGQVGE